MSVAADLPDDALVPMKWVRLHFVPRTNSSERDMTTPELAAEFGHSPDWWQDRARAGVLKGAYQSGERSKWYVPRQVATLYLQSLRGQRRKGSARKPWRGPQKSDTGRPQAVPEGQMVGGGSEAVGRRKADAA